MYLRIDGYCLVYVAVKNDLAVIHYHAAVAKLADGVHIVAYVEDGFALGGGHLAHFVKTLLLEFDVAYGEHLVHYEDVGVEVSGDGERELYVHSRGVALYGGVDKLAALGKLDYLLDLAVDLGAAHAQNGAVEVDVFAAGKLLVEACADLEH